MSRYHPIYKEISVESMRYMREEEHMNNREIAERSESPPLPYTSTSAVCLLS